MTLQNRLIILLVVFALFLIGAFAVIQVNNQSARVNEFNIYQARQEALAARDGLQKVFSPSEEGPPRDGSIQEAKDVFKSILQSGTVKTASLLDREGKPLILEGDLKLFFEDDKSFLQKIKQAPDKWITPNIDKEHKLINLFVNFDNPFGYIVKLTISLGGIQGALNAIYIPLFFTGVIIVIASVLLGSALSWALISPIRMLNQATKDIASGNLDLKVNINTKDEFGELSSTFNSMTQELKKMKQRAENANPLTKLPGNIIIQEEVEERIREGKKFILIYCDLNNFKAFNDKFGVHSGDEALILTADIVKEAIAKEGSKEEFLGHEGGDDFLLLTSPERSERIASYIIREVDKRMISLYPKEDAERGYIEGVSRNGRLKKYPIMSIALAGVGNINREIDSYAQITNIAAEVKKAAKAEGCSKYIMDRRTG